MNTPNNNLKKIQTQIYDKLPCQITHLQNETEGSEYDACTFTLNKLKIICRSGKITPKKSGQFVTFWKRDKNGITEPYAHDDDFDLYVINVKSKNHLGQFVFPKAELIKQGIVSNQRKDGKRGFRIYPIWDKAQSKQAVKTQTWQLNYFYKVGEENVLQKVRELFKLDKA